MSSGSIFQNSMAAEPSKQAHSNNSTKQQSNFSKMFCDLEIIIANTQNEDSICPPAAPAGDNTSSASTDTPAQETTIFKNLQEKINTPEVEFGATTSSFHSYIIHGGILSFFGDNQEGQCGTGDLEKLAQVEPNQFFKDLKDPYGKKMKVRKVSVGMNQTIVLMESHDMYVMGSNENGRLGLPPHFTRLLNPSRNNFFSSRGIQIDEVFCGSWSSFVIDKKRRLFAFGWGESGRLGLGNEEDHWQPQMVPLEEEIEHFSAGFGFSVCCTKSGRVFVWGNNVDGQLGIGHTDEVYSPTVNRFFNNKKVTKIRCAGFHSFVFCGNDIYGFGANSFNQLGLSTGPCERVDIPRKITYFEENNIKIVDCGGGEDFSLFLSDEGDLYGMGWNENCQLGLGDKIDRTNHPEKITLPTQGKVTKYTCGQAHTLALCGKILFVFGAVNNEILQSPIPIAYHGV